MPSNIVLQSHFDEIQNRGYTVLKDIFDSKTLSRMKNDYLKISQIADQMRQGSHERLRIFYENEVENRSVYWKKDQKLILQAGQGRYDLYKGFHQGVFLEDCIKDNPIIEAVVKSAMISDYSHYSGFIQSFPGSEAQYWHRDTHTLSNSSTDGQQLIQVDDFYFTVLIPLTTDFTTENGATEIMAGSHRLASQDFNQCETITAPVPLGGALVFNGKLNHRGGANRSTEERPALYMVYHKKWYNDQFRQGVDD